MNRPPRCVAAEEACAGLPARTAACRRANWSACSGIESAAEHRSKGCSSGREFLHHRSLTDCFRERQKRTTSTVPGCQHPRRVRQGPDHASYVATDAFQSLQIGQMQVRRQAQQNKAPPDFHVAGVLVWS